MRWFQRAFRRRQLKFSVRLGSFKKLARAVLCAFSGQHDWRRTRRYAYKFTWFKNDEGRMDCALKGYFVCQRCGRKRLLRLNFRDVKDEAEPA